MITLDLTAQSDALRTGTTSSLALTREVLAAIESHNPLLNAYLHVDAASALAAAAASDARRAMGHTLGPLDGISVAVKDNIDVAGWPTTAGMATRRGRIAPHDAFVVRRLREAGMVLLGKLNMHEAALGATTDNPHFGRCENPHRAGYTPGGSSGGSAAAVAAGLCALALGTDTMGSVRLPAAYCGVVGLKASFGLISTGGTVACCHALDHVGPLVRSHRDLQLVLPALAAFDGHCPDARRIALREARTHPSLAAASDVAALGVSPEVAEAYEQALVALQANGHPLTRLPLAGYDFGRARRAGLLAVEADMLNVHADDWRMQPRHFSPELTKMLRWAEGQSAAALAAAQRVMAAAHVEVARWWAVGDVMVLPTTPQPAFAFGTPVPASLADLTSIANMAGVPALSVPLPRAAGQLPIGLQLIAPVGHEATLLDLNLNGVIQE